jgi:hypothetical protein
VAAAVLGTVMVAPVALEVAVVAVLVHHQVVQAELAA